MYLSIAINVKCENQVQPELNLYLHAVDAANAAGRVWQCGWCQAWCVVCSESEREDTARARSLVS